MAKVLGNSLLKGSRLEYLGLAKTAAVMVRGPTSCNRILLQCCVDALGGVGAHVRLSGATASRQVPQVLGSFGFLAGKGSLLRKPEGIEFTGVTGGSLGQPAGRKFSVDA